MLPKKFKPNNEYELVRIGSDNDGGYLVEKNSLLASKYLISFGLGLNWSFEKEFFNLRKCPIDCYDHTIKYSMLKKICRKNILNIFKKKNLFNLKLLLSHIKNIFIYRDYKKFFSDSKKHYKSAIGIGRNKKDLYQIIKKAKTSPLFFKIDIEGSEYRILDDLLKFQTLISGLVIEFHNVDLHKQKILDFIENFKLNLCHIHGQNPGGLDYLDKNGDPVQLEMTFTSSNKILSNQAKIPHPLDQPADPRFPEVRLNFEE